MVVLSTKPSPLPTEEIAVLIIRDLKRNRNIVFKALKWAEACHLLRRLVLPSTTND